MNAQELRELLTDDHLEEILDFYRNTEGHKNKCEFIGDSIIYLIEENLNKQIESLTNELEEFNTTEARSINKAIRRGS